MRKVKKVVVASVLAVATVVVVGTCPFSAGAITEKNEVSMDASEERMEEPGELELKLKTETFDYKEEVEIRLNTIDVSISDMKREFARTTDKDIKKDIKKRCEVLRPVYAKYTQILKEVEDEAEYKNIAKCLDADLNKAYEEIN